MANGYRFRALTVTIHKPVYIWFGILVFFYQLQTTIDFSSTSVDWAVLFKGGLLTLGIGDGARKDNLNIFSHYYLN